MSSCKILLPFNNLVCPKNETSVSLHGNVSSHITLFFQVLVDISCISFSVVTVVLAVPLVEPFFAQTFGRD